MYMIFFYVGTFGGLPSPPPPPPPYQKAGYATVASFRSPEEWPNEDGRFRPPHSLHEIAATEESTPIQSCLKKQKTNNEI